MLRITKVTNKDIWRLYRSDVLFAEVHKSPVTLKYELRPILARQSEYPGLVRTDLTSVTAARLYTEGYLARWEAGDRPAPKKGVRDVVLGAV